MFHKAELCFIKARDLYSKQLHDRHRTVGDCTFSLGLLYKRHGKFAKSITLIREALVYYQQGIGERSLKCAHCLEELGKLSILKEAYSEAYKYLENCLEIKKELFRYES